MLKSFSKVILRRPSTRAGRDRTRGRRPDVRTGPIGLKLPIHRAHHERRPVRPQPGVRPVPVSSKVSQPEDVLLLVVMLVLALVLALVLVLVLVLVLLHVLVLALVLALTN